MSIAQRHAEIEVWLVDKVMAMPDPAPSRITIGSAVALTAGVLAVLGAGFLQPLLGPLALTIGFLVGGLACIGGTLGLVLSGSPHKRLVESAVHKGLPRSRLNAALWCTEHDGNLEDWREVALANLLWWRHWDGHSISSSEHAQLAALLRRGVERPGPLQMRLLGPQAEYLERSEALETGKT